MERKPIYRVDISNSLRQLLPGDAVTFSSDEVLANSLTPAIRNVKQNTPCMTLLMVRNVDEDGNVSYTVRNVFVQGSDDYPASSPIEIKRSEAKQLIQTYMILAKRDKKKALARLYSLKEKADQDNSVRRQRLANLAIKIMLEGEI